MLTLDESQEKQLRKELKKLIKERDGSTQAVEKYYGYKIKSEGAQGERIYFRKLNLYSNEYYWEPNMTTTQAKQYFNIK